MKPHTSTNDAKPGATTTAARITALPEPLLDAVHAVHERVQACDRLDAALDACPGDRARLDNECSNLSEKLASAEADLALCDRGSDAEVRHLTNVEELVVSMTSFERERKRLDNRELALESQGEPLAEKLTQAVAELRREMYIFTATLCEGVAAEFRAALPPLLVARARLNALATLDHSLRDAIWDSRLINPTSGYFHLVLDGSRRQLSADEDLLASEHPDATIAGDELATLLKPIMLALAAGRRPPFRTLRERRMANAVYIPRGYEIRSWRPDVPATPPKPPVPLEEQSRSYTPTSDSFGARTRGATADVNTGAQITANLMKGD
jgi:hypothetical protein